jgi:hypothetical protein
LSAAAEEAKRRAAEALGEARDKVETELSLRSETADTILAAFKPPK